MLAVDRCVGAETADEFDAVAAAGDGQDARATHFRELKCQHPNVSASAVDDDALTRFDVQRVVDSL